MPKINRLQFLFPYLLRCYKFSIHGFESMDIYDGCYFLQIFPTIPYFVFRRIIASGILTTSLMPRK